MNFHKSILYTTICLSAQDKAERTLFALSDCGAQNKALTHFLFSSITYEQQRKVFSRSCYDQIIRFPTELSEIMKDKEVCKAFVKLNTRQNGLHQPRKFKIKVFYHARQYLSLLLTFCEINSEMHSTHNSTHYLSVLHSSFSYSICFFPFRLSLF